MRDFFWLRLYYLLTVISIVHVPVGHDLKWLWPTAWGLVLWALARSLQPRWQKIGRPSLLPSAVRATLTANLLLLLLIVLQGGRGLTDLVRARSTPLDEKLEQLLTDHPTSVVVGMDLLGKEPGYPALETGQLVYGAAVADRPAFHRTIHAAGLGEIRNLRDAILMGAERIGHGTRWLESPVSLEYAARRRLPIEVNLVSNVRLGYADDYQSHHAVDLLRLGLRVSLSTDDEGILGTSLSNEFAMCIEHTEITYAEVKQLIYNSIATAFCGDSERRKLRERLGEELAQFESQWRNQLRLAVD